MARLLTMLMLLLPVFGAGALDVRDFGARGDGVTDDTAAIQAALNKARALETFVLAGFSEKPAWGGHGGHGGYGRVFLPAGEYVISDTLVYDRRKIILEGEPGTVIRQTNPDRDILYFDRIFRCQVRGITFEGGYRQLVFFTANNDMTGLDVSGCRFRNSSGPAILGETRRVNGAFSGPWRVA